MLKYNDNISLGQTQLSMKQPFRWRWWKLLSSLAFTSTMISPSGLTAHYQNVPAKPLLVRVILCSAAPTPFGMEIVLLRSTGALSSTVLRTQEQPFPSLQDIYHTSPEKGPKRHQERHFKETPQTTQLLHNSPLSLLSNNLPLVYFMLLTFFAHTELGHTLKWL